MVFIRMVSSLFCSFIHLHGLLADYLVLVLGALISCVPCKLAPEAKLFCCCFLFVCLFVCLFCLLVEHLVCANYVSHSFANCEKKASSKQLKFIIIYGEDWIRFILGNHKNNISTCCVLFPFVLCSSCFSWSFLLAKCFLNYDSEVLITGKNCFSIANCQLINFSLDNG